jgi:hypothetical protein
MMVILLLMMMIDDCDEGVQLVGMKKFHMEAIKLRSGPSAPSPALILVTTNGKAATTEIGFRCWYHSPA